MITRSATTSSESVKVQPHAQPRAGRRDERQHAQCKRRVGRHCCPPAVAALPARVHRQVDRDRDDHAAERRHHRDRPSPSLPQLADVQFPLGLEADHEEVEGHEAVVQPVAQVLGDDQAPYADGQRRSPHRLVAVPPGRVGPGERRKRRREEHERPSRLRSHEAPQRTGEAAAPERQGGERPRAFTGDVCRRTAKSGPTEGSGGVGDWGRHVADQPHRQVGVDARCTLLTVDGRPVGGECQPSVGCRRRFPPLIRIPHGARFLPPVDICVDGLVDQSRVSVHSCIAKGSAA